MTTFVIIGNNAELKGVEDASEHLITYHVNAVKVRFGPELQEKLVALKTARLEEMEPVVKFADYKFVLKDLDRKFGAWSVRDDRVLFFIDELAGLVDKLALVYVENKDNETLDERCSDVYDSFKGPKLRLAKADAGKLKDFVAEVQGTKKATTTKAVTKPFSKKSD